MPPLSFSIRAAGASDRVPVTRLLRRSYPQLLCHDYAPTTLRAALPLITSAQPSLLGCGTYFLAEDDETGVVIGAGGWTDFSPARGISAVGDGHMRHLATDPDHLRGGVARALTQHALASAHRFGMQRMHCMSTLSAQAFYSSMGFEAYGEIELTLAPGVYFPAIQMILDVC